MKKLEKEYKETKASKGPAENSEKSTNHGKRSRLIIASKESGS